MIDNNTKLEKYQVHYLPEFHNLRIQSTASKFIYNHIPRDTRVRRILIMNVTIYNSYKAKSSTAKLLCVSSNYRCWLQTLCALWKQAIMI